MSIIPVIARPAGPANRSQQTIFSGSLHIASSHTIYGVGDFIRLYFSDHYGVSDVTIDGTLWAASTTGVSSALVGMYMSHITITGTVAAEARVANAEFGQANATAVFNGSFGSSVTNSGTIYAYTDVGFAYGIEHWGPDVAIVNSGLIAAQTEGHGDPRISGASAIMMYNGGTLHNQAGGEILAEGTNARAVLIGRGDTNGATNIVNDGTIRAVALGEGQRSVGLEVSNFSHEMMLIVNNGLIEADIAIQTGSPTWPETPSDQTVQNSASGVIRGDIEGDLGVETILNSGLIEGDILLGDGDDLIDNSQGRHLGRVELDWGNDTFIGGSSNERVDGGRMDDDLHGGGGRDLLLGGLGDDRLVGGWGNDGLYGDYGNDSFVLWRADAAFGGQGADHFLLTDLTFASIDGGEGVDTIELPALSATFDIASLFDGSRVSGIEIVDLGTSGRVSLSAADMTAAVDGLRIVGTGEIALAGSWSDMGAATIDGADYRVFAANGCEVFVLASLVVSEQADMPPDTFGLDAVAGGAAAPRIEDDPDLEFANPVFSNARVNVTGDLVIESYETWRVNSHWGAFHTEARESTITNHGRIIADEGPEGYVNQCVVIDTLGQFINHGMIVSRDTSLGSQTVGLVSHENASIINTGEILASVEDGLAQGARISGTLDNSGLIRATATTGEAEAVSMSRDVGINSGAIEAFGETRAIALNIRGDFFFTNSGTIEATAANAENAADATAVYLSSSTWESTFVNSGSIVGSVAIAAQISPYYPQYSYFSGTLQIFNEAGGVIDGDILLAESDDHIVNDGQITGDVELDDGRDVFDSRNGSFAGTIDGGGDDDRIYAGAGSQTIFGGDGDDQLDGGAGADQLTGGNGNDVLIGGAGNDTLGGGSGVDTASYQDAISGVSVTLATETVQDTRGAGLDRLVSIENLSGSNFDDTLTGNQQDNVLIGNDGDDDLWGGGGRDILSGGMGDDLLHAGGGIDTVSYENAAAGVIVTLSRQGIAQNTVGDGVDTLVSVENLTGSGFDDRLFGDGGGNTLQGLAGSDFLNGRDGADTILGGAGDDRLLGGNGDDVLDGGDGADALLGGAGIDTLRGGTGSDQYYLDTAADLVIEVAGEGIDSVFAGFDYTLPDNVEVLRLLAGTWNGTGNALDNTLYGSAGANTLLGLDGDDRLFGEGGPDVLDGGAGNDRLFGGIGRDTMTGGSGADRFVFESTEDLGESYGSADVITDFDGSAGDRIHLVGIDAVAGTAQDEAFAFIGSDAFSGTAGELRYFSNRNGTFIELDTDGDGLSDFAIRLEGQIDLTASDFFL